MKNKSSKTIKSTIIYITIITGTIFVILITLMFQLKSELTLAQSIPSITLVAVTGFIGVFTYHYQSKGEKRRIQVVQEISKIAKDQERINVALVRGQLIVIGKEIGYLSDILGQYLRKLDDSKSDQDTLNLFLQFKEEKKKEFDEKYRNR
jgi:hypothetical protein